MEKNDIKQYDLIYEEGEKLYPISSNSDKKCYIIENWAEMFYHLKEGKSKERFIELIKNSEYSTFFEGLNYEYGINNCPQDLMKAFQIYKEAANNTTDSMSMFRMYHIYKKDFNKFNIPKRNRIFEKFYLFKCYSFARYPIIERAQNLCNRFDITNEINIHFEEDLDLLKFHDFIDFLNKNYKYYDINPKDLIIISAIINLDLSASKQEIRTALEKLKNLAFDEENLEALYKLTCISKKNNKEEIEKNFKILFDKAYFRSYVDYALFLNENKRYKEALEVLKIARKHGIISAGYIYYDIYLDDNDFSLIMNEAQNSSFSKECELYNLINILIDDILTESIYSFFEFIYFRKLCVKYNLEENFNYHFFDYTKEIADFLIKITNETNINNKKKIIYNYFFREDFFQELHLACGTLYFYGIKNDLEIDYTKSLDKIIIANNNSNLNSYKRFCYYYIYRIHKKLFDGMIGFISENEIKDTEKDLFNKYYSSINENISDLSSSYFYYLSTLFHKKIGNNGDRLLEFICINKASDYRNDTPGSGSIISIYRKQKSKILKEKYKDEITEEFNKIKAIDAEGYGDDGTICPICYEKNRNTISLPCKHLFCDFCLSKVDKCPICRRSILMTYIIS